MKHPLFWLAVLLLVVPPSQAQTAFPLAESPQLPTPIPQSKALGDLALAPIGNQSVVLVLDRQETLEDEVGLADLIVVLRIPELTGDLPTVRDFGLYSPREDGFTVTFPRQQLRFDFTLPASDELSAGGATIAAAAFEAWVPSVETPVTVDEALSIERARNARVQNVHDNLFEKDDGTSGGGCAASKSIVCHDGTSASASCTSGCAVCECTPAACACS